MEDEEFSMYENRFGSRDLSLQAAAAAESLNSTSFLDQIDDGIGELRAHPEQLERNPSSSRVFDVDKTGLGVRAAYVHPSSASSSLIDQSDDDMGGRQSTTLWNADKSSAAIHGMEEDDSEEKDEENEGGRGGIKEGEWLVFLDDSGKYFYHRPLESCNEDLSMFLLGSDVYVNDEPPDHAPLITGTGRFVYVTNVTSKSDVKKCKVDLSGKWNEKGNKDKGILGCRETTSSCTVTETDGCYIWVDLSHQKEPIQRVVTEYYFKEPGEVIRLTGTKRVDDDKKMEIKRALLIKTTKQISAEHDDVTTSQIQNITRNVPERRKLNVGRKKEIDWAELEKELRQNEFLKASVVKNDLQMLICWNTEVLKVFAASLPTARELENSRRDDLSLLSLPTDERNAKIREQFESRGARPGQCFVDITFERDTFYCGKLLSLNTLFRKKDDHQVPSFPVAFFFSKKHRKLELIEFTRTISQAVIDLGPSFTDRRVRSIVRDGESGLDGILQSPLFECCTVLRCEVHMRKNCKDALSDEGDSVASFVLGFTSRGCRESGLMDCCTVGAANRALLSVKERKVFSPGAIEWIEDRLERYYKTNGLPNRLRALIAECRQAPFGGASLIIGGSPLIYRSIWMKFTQSARDAHLSKVGIDPAGVVTLPKGWKVGKTSKVAGRTQGEFAALITSTRDLNVEKRPDNSFLIIHRETDDSLAVFLNAEFGRDEAVKHSSYLLNMDAYRLKQIKNQLRSFDDAKGGKKGGIRRWGGESTKSSHGRVCLAVEQGDMVTDASPQFLNLKPQTRRPLALPPPSRTRQTDGMDEDYTQSDQLDMDVTYPATDDTISFTEAPSENKESMFTRLKTAGRIYNEEKKREAEKRKMMFDEEDDETTVNVVVESSVKPANLGNEMVEAASSTEKYDLGDFVTPSVLPPKTNLHHNDNPFIIGSIIEKVPVNVVSRRTCVACRAPLPSSSSNPNIVIFPLERVQTNFNGDRIIRTLMAITHASRKCLRSRYPYSHKGMLLASQQLILRQTEADKLFLLKEFDVDLNSLGVAIRYENRRFKIDRIFIHFHRHHLELFPRIALLWGRNMRQRAYELIQIAHPDQRQNLE
ncbi:hypothetical protein PRIPAC_82292 [Pristionchus pacificus]|uniref:Uncharacterized protein n=1 Tax=Pristionchus pacificus TaxID=54126 RepID=A0A2A6C4K6_PRIPA|nr:hypothetical protein PRIPAC_82292 [Pristionchus pacificus]|eukprot:PDM72983.1 hypothetical protein PRIPAC_39417 [Pristionchus pacificus]